MMIFIAAPCPKNNFFGPPRQATVRTALFPKIGAMTSRDLSFEESRFRTDGKAHSKTARAVVAKELLCVNSFTLETSFFAQTDPNASALGGASPNGGVGVEDHVGHSGVVGRDYTKKLVRALVGRSARKLVKLQEEDRLRDHDHDQRQEDLLDANTEKQEIVPMEFEFDDIHLSLLGAEEGSSSETTPVHWQCNSKELFSTFPFSFFTPFRLQTIGLALGHAMAVYFRLNLDVLRRAGSKDSLAVRSFTSTPCRSVVSTPAGGRREASHGQRILAPACRETGVRTPGVVGEIAAKGRAGGHDLPEHQHAAGPEEDRRREEFDVVAEAPLGTSGAGSKATSSSSKDHSSTSTREGIGSLSSWRSGPRRTTSPPSIHESILLGAAPSSPISPPRNKLTTNLTETTPDHQCSDLNGGGDVDDPRPAAPTTFTLQPQMAGPTTTSWTYYSTPNGDTNLDTAQAFRALWGPDDTVFDSACPDGRCPWLNFGTVKSVDPMEVLQHLIEISGDNVLNLQAAGDADDSGIDASPEVVVEKRVFVEKGLSGSGGGPPGTRDRKGSTSPKPKKKAVRRRSKEDFPFHSPVKNLSKDRFRETI